ncbi:hypothetical protein D3C81_1522690 [compost metagenome]
MSVAEKRSEEVGELLIEHVVHAGHPDDIHHQAPKLAHFQQAQRRFQLDRFMVQRQAVRHRQRVVLLRFEHIKQAGQHQCKARRQPKRKLVVDGKHIANDRRANRPADTAKQPGTTILKLAAAAHLLDIGFNCGRASAAHQPQVNPAQ